MRFAGTKRISVSNEFGGYNFNSPDVRGSASRLMSRPPGGDDVGPVAPDPGVISEDAAEVMSAVPRMNQEADKQQASFAVGAKAEATAQKIYRKAEEDARKKMERAQNKSGIIKTAFGIGKMLVPFI